MPGPVSDAYDPVWGTTANGEEVHNGIQDMDVALTKILKNSPPRCILTVIREANGPKTLRKLSERELRILRYACRVALGTEKI